MRRLIIVCLLVLIGHMVYGQAISKRTIESLKVSSMVDDIGIFSYRVSSFKFSIKPMIDFDEVGDMFDGEEYGDDMGDGGEDYIGLGKYDIRVKYSLSRRFSIKYRVVSSDLLLLGDKRQYLGFVYKF